jgi:MHS family citrate/tricarballylate:H+ symporter-like MFS transporter
MAELATTFEQPFKPVSLPARQVLAVVVGNALEFYDFLTYAFFAAQIGRTFFPSASAESSLLASLATFGAGFITRPIGAVVIGSIGDRVGRKPAMLLSFSMMGIAIIGLALTPSYRVLGMVAPILVICFRLLQGFALGGEVGPTTAFMIEAAPPERRGFYGSLQYATQNVAVLCAGGVGTILASLLGAQQLDDWGWRIAFLIGACIVPFGLYIRRGLNETLKAPAADEADAAPARIRPYLRIAALGLLMLLGGTVSTYVLDYMTTYASATLHMKANAAFGATLVIGSTGVCFNMISGWLSDKVGRKPVMITFWVLLLCSVLPAFSLISRLRTPVALLGASAFLSMLLELGTTPVLISITESIPRHIRSGMVATIYALSISVFGGSTQFIITWLIHVTGNPLAPAWYMTGAIVIGLVAMGLMQESAPVKRKGRPAS